MANIDSITIYRNFNIFLDDIDMIRYGKYRLDISFGLDDYIVASLVTESVWLLLIQAPSSYQRRRNLIQTETTVKHVTTS